MLVLSYEHKRIYPKSESNYFHRALDGERWEEGGGKERVEYLHSYIHT